MANLVGLIIFEKNVLPSHSVSTSSTKNSSINDLIVDMPTAIRLHS